jgi:hypothetical protein
MATEQFRYENPQVGDTALIVARTATGLVITVTDETATFKCSIELPMEEAQQLRFYLNRILPV